MLHGNSNVGVVAQSDTALRHAIKMAREQLAAGNLLPFLGAGISSDPPSRMPMASALIRPLLTELLEAVRVVAENTNASADERNVAVRVLETARLERLLDALHDSHGADALEYLGVLQSDAWNANHAAVGALTAAGLLTHCITLNFDLLTEAAIVAHGGGCHTICPLTSGRFECGAVPASATVLKPHGSLWPAGGGRSSFEHMSATLSKVGNQPDRRNVAALEHALEACPTLLVAGYSDHDWDIFPILQRLQSRLRRVIWIDYATSEQIASGNAEESASEPVRSRVLPWLRSCEAECSLLVGNPTDFFGELLRRVGIEAKKPMGYGEHQSPPDASRFHVDADRLDSRGMRTILAMASLIQNTGAFADKAARWLRDCAVATDDAEVAWRGEDLIGHEEHTRADLTAAVKCTKRVIAIKRSITGVSADDVSEHILWLGYEYFCLAKRPDPRHPSSLLLLPWRVWRGSRLLNQATADAAPEERNRVDAMAKYYRADLLHAWANLAMVFRGATKAIWTRLLRRVAHMYDEVAANSDMMDVDYYWMRHLEARLLADCPIDQGLVEARLAEIATAHELIQHNVQMGNSSIYRALLAHVLGGDAATAARWLDDAERRWRESGEDLRAGHRRVVLFRRFIGQLSFVAALRGFLQNEK